MAEGEGKKERQPRGWLEKRTAKVLREQGELSRIDLLCHVYGYRHSNGRVLQWSILEQLHFDDQNRQDGERRATELLQRVVAEAERIGFPPPPQPKPNTEKSLELFRPGPRLVKRGNKDVLRAKRAAAQAVGAIGSTLRLAGVNPFGTGGALLEAVGQSRQLTESAGLAKTLSQMDTLSPVQRGILALGAVAASRDRALNLEDEVETDDVYEDHPWQVADRAVRPYLERWDWPRWLRHPVEVECRDDLGLGLQTKLDTAHANLTRVLKRMVSKGLVRRRAVGERELYSLVAASVSPGTSG